MAEGGGGFDEATWRQAAANEHALVPAASEVVDSSNFHAGSSLEMMFAVRKVSKDRSVTMADGKSMPRINVERKLREHINSHHAACQDYARNPTAQFQNVGDFPNLPTPLETQLANVKASKLTIAEERKRGSKPQFSDRNLKSTSDLDEVMQVLGNLPEESTTMHPDPITDPKLLAAMRENSLNKAQLFLREAVLHGDYAKLSLLKLDVTDKVYECAPWLKAERDKMLGK